MKKDERTAAHAANANSDPKDFHIHFSHGTAAWLRLKRNRDAPSVPAVVRKIIEEAERRDKMPRKARQAGDL